MNLEVNNYEKFDNVPDLKVRYGFPIYIPTDENLIVPQRLPQGEDLLDSYSYVGGENHSNFKALGIGKETAKQKKRRAKLKKALHDASVNISNTSHDAAKNISHTIGDKLGGGKMVHAINKFYPLMVTMRGAMLGIINTNLVDISHAFYLIKTAKNKKHWEQLLQKWWMFGGDKAHFDKAVERSKNKKPLLKAFVEAFAKKKKHNFDGFSNADGGNSAAGIVSSAGGLMASVAGVSAAIPEPFLSKTVTALMAAGGSGMAAISGILKSFSKDNGATPAQVASIPTTSNFPTGNSTLGGGQISGDSSPSVLPADFNPDAIPTELPSDPKTLDKIADEMNAITKAEKKGEDPTLVSAHTDPAISVSGTDKIFGLPKTVVYIGGAILILGIGLLLFKKFSTKKIN